MGSPVNTPNAYQLGDHRVDDDYHVSVLVEIMDATGQWDATRALRQWERRHLALAQGERLLDVGCGTGDAALALAHDLGSRGALVGVDVSAEMLAVADRRSRSAPCAVRFTVADAMALTEAERSFDVARSERTLQWLADPDAAVGEMCRMVRPAGRVSLIDTDWSTLRINVDNSAVSAKIGDAVRVERNRPSNVGSRLAALLTAAGLEVIAETTATQRWHAWNPDESLAPNGCFSMESLADDLVDAGQLEPTGTAEFVATIHDAARRGRFAMSLTMYAAIGVLRPADAPAPLS